MQGLCRQVEARKGVCVEVGGEGGGVAGEAGGADIQRPLMIMTVIYVTQHLLQ